MEFEWNLAKIIMFEDVHKMNNEKKPKTYDYEHLDKTLVYEYLSDIITTDFSNKTKQLILDKNMYERLPKLNKYIRRIEKYTNVKKYREEILEFWKEIDALFYKICCEDNNYVVVYKAYYL